jgi:hypothetical protein
VATATQSWVHGLAEFLAQHPSDWAFVFDRRWSALFEAAAKARSREAGA